MLSCFSFTPQSKKEVEGMRVSEGKKVLDTEMKIER